MQNKLKNQETVRGIINTHKGRSSLFELAERADVSPSLISSLVSRGTSVKLESLLKITEALGLKHGNPDFEVLLEGCGIKRPERVHQSEIYRRTYREIMAYNYMHQPPFTCSPANKREPPEGFVPDIVKLILSKGLHHNLFTKGGKKIRQINNLTTPHKTDVGLAVVTPLNDREAPFSYSVSIPGVRNSLLALRIKNRTASGKQSTPKELFNKELPEELNGKQVLTIRDDLGDLFSRYFRWLRAGENQVNIDNYTPDAVLASIKKNEDIAMVLTDGPMAGMLTEGDNDFEYVAEHSSFQNTDIRSSEAMMMRAVARPEFAIPFPKTEQVKWRENFNTNFTRMCELNPDWLVKFYRCLIEETREKLGYSALSEYAAHFDKNPSSYPFDTPIRTFPDTDQRLAQILLNTTD